MKPIKKVEDIEPLISYYAGILGDKPGRLMAALSLLADLEYTDDWQAVSPEARLSIELARTLTADVFKGLVSEAEDNGEGQFDSEMERLFKGWTNGREGEAP